MKEPTKCLECGGRVQAGYGLMGGGVGAYWACVRARCGWFFKERECPFCETVLDVDGSCPCDHRDALPRSSGARVCDCGAVIVPAKSSEKGAT